MGRFHPFIVLRTPDHIAWVLIQQIMCKGLFGIKFLFAARILGPERFGLVGVAIAALAIVESLADTGMMQAIIQRPSKLAPSEAGAVWTLQLLRGAIIATALAVSAGFIARLFGIPDSATLIMVAAILPLIRNAVHPGFFLLQRERNFRAVSLSESLSSGVDFFAALTLLESGCGPVSVLLGSCSGDAIRLALSWSKFRIPLQANLKWKKISDLGRYGLWIWASSILAVLLNQFDKFVVARWLGPASFGVYQTSSRLAQLGISDIALAAGQYLFPTMARMHNERQADGKKYFYKALLKMSIISGFLSAALICFAPFLVGKILGEKWISAIPVIRIQCVSMWFGAMIAVCVAFLRASGRPHVVTYSSIIQLFVLIMPSYWVINRFGVIGMAWLVFSALGVSLLYMVKQALSGVEQCA